MAWSAVLLLFVLCSIRGHETPVSKSISGSKSFTNNLINKQREKAPSPPPINTKYKYHVIEVTLKVKKHAKTIDDPDECKRANTLPDIVKSLVSIDLSGTKTAAAPQKNKANRTVRRRLLVFIRNKQCFWGRVSLLVAAFVC